MSFFPSTDSPQYCILYSMISKYTYKGLVWIDLESPSKEEIMSLMDEYRLPVLVGEEMFNPTLRSKVDRYENLVYTVLHFPILKPGITENALEREVDFVIGKKFMITVHYETVDPLHEFSKLFEINSFLDKSDIGDHAGFLFYHALKELYKHTQYELDELHELIRSIEHQIFSHREGEMVRAISKANRVLIDFKRAIHYHGDILRSLETTFKEFIGGDFIFYIRNIESERNRIQSTVDRHHDILTDLRETNDSLLNEKTNKVIKRLTIFSIITLPASMIAWIFSMDSQFLALDEIDNLVMVFGAMIVSSIIVVYYLWKKRWL